MSSGVGRMTIDTYEFWCRKNDDWHIWVLV